LWFLFLLTDIRKEIEERHEMNPLEKDNERVEWINNIIRRGWYTYRKVIATQVVESLQQTIVSKKDFNRLVSSLMFILNCRHCTNLGL
jgi:hypothetical protein